MVILRKFFWKVSSEIDLTMYITTYICVRVFLYGCQKIRNEKIFFFFSFCHVLKNSKRTSYSQKLGNIELEKALMEYSYYMVAGQGTKKSIAMYLQSFLLYFISEIIEQYNQHICYMCVYLRITIPNKNVYILHSHLQRKGSK